MYKLMRRVFSGRGKVWVVTGNLGKIETYAALRSKTVDAFEELELRKVRPGDAEGSMLPMPWPDDFLTLFNRVEYQ